MRVTFLSFAIFLFACAGVAAQDAPSVAQWRLAQRVRIGEVDGRNALGSVEDVTVGTDGAVYIADGLERGVRVYSGSGQLRRVIGRRGTGPAEFEAVGRLSWIGDTLAVEDPALQRFSFFTRAGVALGTFRPTAGAFISIGVFTDRSILTQPRSTIYGREGAPRMPLLRVSGARVDTVARIRAYGSGACVGDRIRVCLRAPIGTADIVAVDPRGKHFTVISNLRATGADRRAFTVTRLSARGDTLTKTSISYTPEPVPRSYGDSLTAHWIELLVNPPGNRPKFTREEATAAVRDGLQLPRYYPAVYAVTIARNGDIWLQIHSSNGGMSWLVLAPDGRQKAMVTGAPARFVLHHVDDDSVWGVVKDDMDVPYVVGLAIVTR